MTPDTIGPYRIDRELGSGGMGKVYAAVVEGRAAGLPEGTRVALKVVHPHLLETPGFFKRFLREAELGKAVRHPNVVRTFDCDAGGGRHFMAMEFVAGQTLRELLEELDRVPEELCRHIGQEVAKGLGAIHAAGAIYRDMKPENVLITEDHVVKVMDLGVARLVDEAVRLSQTGAFVGSLCYAAPESFRKGEVDGRVDLHALGLVLYELACGSNPYLADGVPETIQKVLRDQPRRLGDLNPQISPFFEEVVHCLLEKDRDERFPSADELAAVLADGEESDWWHRRASAIRSVTKRPLRRVRIPRETAVYGREEELAKLRALYDAASAGEGNVALIEGEAGIGKSRLVDELLARLHRDGEDVNFLFGSYPPGGAATASGGFSTAYREQLGEAGCADLLTASPVLIPAFDALLRGEPTPQGHEPLTKHSLQTCFVNVTRSLAAERPTIVLIDDLHFAPEEGRALFSALAMALPGHRVLLIGTTRPGVSKDWLAGATRLDQTTHMSLHRLGPKDLMALLQDTLGSEQLAHDLAGQIATKSDGNPFFVFEILQGLREGQFITRGDDGTWVGTKVIDDIQIPSSVLDLVNARVADLTEEERELLDVAACWGYEFDATLIGDCLGRARIPTLRQLALIEKRHRLVRCVGERFVFDHHQVQEALYRALPPQLAREYHAVLAETLERRSDAAEHDPAELDGALCVDLCKHHLAGGRGERAVRYLASANAHLARGYVFADVVSLTERVLAVPGLLTGAERGGVLLSISQATGPLERIGRRTRQIACIREAERLAEEAGDQGLLVRAVGSLGSALGQASQHEEAEAACRRAIELARTAGDRTTEAGAIGNLGTALWVQGRLDEARAHLEEQLQISRDIGDLRGEATANGNLANVLSEQGDFLGAKASYERHLALSRERGDRVGEAIATGNLGLACLLAGYLDDAQAYMERQIPLTREIGNRPAEIVAAGNLGNLFQEQGRLAEARERYEQHLALSREIGQRQGVAIALHNIAGVLREMGEFDQADEHFVASLALSTEIEFRYLTASTYGALGSLRIASGRREEGRSSLEAARDLAIEIGVPDVETLARCELALLPGGDAQDAIAAVARNEARIPASSLLRCHHLVWKLTGDRAHLETAKRLLDEAVGRVDEKTRTSMLTNLRLNREIMAAWREEFGDDDDGGQSGGESETRVA